MEQQKPQIPSLKDSQKPQVKIKGLQAGLSLIDRLKQFKKKDLMFISAGLGVLFMAPLAEHLLMAPEQGRGGAMTEGWSFGKNDGLGTNVSPYESGINGLAPGGVTGGGDIITPLNVRDPSALVMGPGAQQQAPATNTTPAPPPPAKEDDKGWRDALANSASAAAKEATKKASLPVPKPSLTNAGLRGLGAVAGGGGGSFSPGAISSQGLAGNKAAGRDFTRVQAAPGYRGAAGARGANSGSSGSFENLKKAAGGMTDTLNRSGPASSALESAANTGMGGGAGSGIGGGGHGPDEKGPSGSQNKDSMNVGESLEFMRQKMEQEKAIDLKWKLKEADAMLWPELRKDILKTLVTKPLEGLAGDIGKSFGAWGGAKGGSKDVYECDGPGGKISFNRGDVVSCRDSSVGGKEGSARYCIEGSTIRDLNLNGATYANCQIKAGEATAGAPKVEGGAGSVSLPGSDAGDNYGGKSLDWLCAEIKKAPDPGLKPSASGGDGLADLARRTLEVRNVLYQGHKAGEDKACEPRDLVGKKLNDGGFGTFKLENQSGYTLKGKAAEMPKTVAKGQMAAMQMLHDGELSVAKQDADVIKLRSANAAGMAKREFLTHDAKVTGPLGKNADTYEPGWVAAYKQAASDGVAKAVEAPLKEANDGVKKVEGEGDKVGVLKEASAWLGASEILLKDIKGSGSGAERVGLPTSEELKRLEPAVKDIGKTNPEVPQHFDNLKKIVEYQGKVLAKAEEIQAEAKKVLATKEKEKDIAVTNQPGISKMPVNAQALVSKDTVGDIAPVNTEKFPGSAMTFKAFFDKVEGGDAEKISGKALPTKGEMEAYKKVRDVELPAAQKSGDADKIKEVQEDLVKKKNAIETSLKAAATAYNEDKQKVIRGVAFVSETQAEAAGEAAEELGSEAKEIKFDYKP